MTTPSVELPSSSATQRHIRGSAIVLVGRAVALLINFVGQVLIVRYLAKLEFGAFAFATSIVSGVSTLIVLGLDKSLARFTAIHHEEQDYARMFGTILVAGATVVGIGTLVVAGFLATGLTVGFPFASNDLAAALLLLMITMAPFHAIDGVLLALFGVFASPGAIFVRRHLLGPGLKLLVVILVILGGGGIYMLAIGQMAGQVFGVVVGLALLVGIFRRQALLDGFQFRNMTCRTRELFNYSLPVVTSDLMMVFRVAMVVFLLEWLRGSTDVAELRAVYPLARLNEAVMATFAVMYVPTLSRMLARREDQQMNDLYWQTAAWTMSLCFPLFAVCFVFATPVAVLLFGAEYASSGPVLALLALGSFAQAAFGFNAQTLRVQGHVRLVALIDLVTLVVAIAGNLLLIPRFGTMGAAVATTGALLLQIGVNQIVLVQHTDVHLFSWRYAKPYLAAAAGLVVLIVVRQVWQPSLPVGVGVAAVVSAGVFYVGRRSLNISSTIPELARVPLIGKVFN